MGKGKTVKPGSGQSSGRVNYTEGAAGRIHVMTAESTNPRAANPSKPPSSPPPVHGWQNGSYCPNCGTGVRVGGGCACGTMRNAAQKPSDKGGTGAVDSRRSEHKKPSIPGNW
jgi:hypothetical protein